MRPNFRSLLPKIGFVFLIGLFFSQIGCTPRFVIKDRMKNVKKMAMVAFVATGFIPWKGEPMRNMDFLKDAMSILFNEVRKTAQKQSGDKKSLTDILTDSWKELEKKAPDVVKKMIAGGLLPGGSVVSKVEDSFIKDMNNNGRFSLTRVQFSDLLVPKRSILGFKVRAQSYTYKGEKGVQTWTQYYATPNGQPEIVIKGAWSFFGLLGLGSRGPTIFGNKPKINKKEFKQFWARPELSGYDGFMVAQTWYMDRSESALSGGLKSAAGFAGLGGAVETLGRSGTYQVENRTEIFAYDKQGLIWYDYQDGKSDTTFGVVKGVTLKWDTFEKAITESYSDFSMNALGYFQGEMGKKTEEKKKDT